jgi:antitoxin component YwqK of YwqJK toxin-antitoxin module
MRDPVVMRALLVLVLTLSAACSRPRTFTSNFATVQIAEGAILTASNRDRYTGTLVARDEEISAIAKTVLGELHRHVDGIALAGLVLVMPVERGVPSGVATLYVDLDATKLHPAIARRSALARTAARMRGGAIKLAEATFKAGKLDGTATVFQDGAKGAQVQLRDHVPHGTAVEYYPGTSQPMRELAFDRGQQAGLQRWYFRNGKLRREASYAAGRPEGEVKELYATGAPRATLTYAGGRLVRETSWFPTGQKQSELTYDRDEAHGQRWYSNGASTGSPPDGVIEEFHATGGVHTRTTYAAGVKQGAFAVFYGDGKPWKQGAYAAGRRVGPSKEWWNNGQLALQATYVDDVLHGDLERFYSNGKRWETAHYERGTRTGPYRKWWKNGTPAHAYTYNARGKLDGEYKQRYDNGAAWVSATYADGKPQGAIQRWYPDGKLGSIMNHANGRPDGPYRRWYANGKPRLEVTYVRGQLDGELRNWLEDGTVYELATYEHGRKVKSTRAPSSSVSDRP